MEEQDYKTDEWKLYERGKSYNTTMSLYIDTEKNYDFYNGKQWKNASLGSIQPITLNVIKPIVKAKIAVLNSNLYQIVFSPNVYDTYDEEQQQEEMCKTLNKYSSKAWELEQVTQKLRETLKDACINAEGIIHAYEEDGKIKFEIIDKTNIYYGNENDSDIQDQPYILITYRRTVDSVKEEAKNYGTSQEEIDKITMDSDYEEQSGRDARVEEVSPMCLVVLKYFKKDGTVWMKKSTKNAIVCEEQDTKLKLYPVAHMLWEEVKGYARGNGEVKYLIPNQIEINKTATRRSIAVQICAYPKLVVNMKYITNPDALEKVGSTVKVNEMSADDVSKIATYLKPTLMSSDALALQQELMSDTRELAGASDSATGNVDPTQASGTAILAVQRTAQQPLNEQLEKFKTFMEDLARVWFEMLQTYSTDGIVATQEQQDPQTGETYEVPYKISYQDLEKMKFNIKIDITPKSAFDKYSQEQSLENLLVKGLITFEEYVSSLDADSDMPKAKLEKIISDRKIAQQRIMEIQMAGNRLNSAMNQVMEMQGGGQQAQQPIQGGNANEMSTMQAS